MVEDIPELLYVSVGCNQTEQSIVAIPSSTALAVAGGPFVAIFDYKNEESKHVDFIKDINVPRTLVSTLKGHKAVVNSIEILNLDQNVNLLVSSDSASSIIVWISDQHSNLDYNMIHTIDYHKASVINLSLFKINFNSFILASCSTDGEVIITKLSYQNGNVSKDSWSFEKIQSFVPFRNIPLSLKFLPINVFNSESKLYDAQDYLNYPLLALAGTNHHITLYTPIRNTADDTKSSIIYKQSIVLKGHTNWVRSLDHIVVNSSNANQVDILLASGSQDKYIRVWKISYSLDNVKKAKDIEDGIKSNSLINNKETHETKFHIDFDATANVIEIQDQLSKVLADAGLTTEDNDKLSTKVYAFSSLIPNDKDNNEDLSINITAMLDTVLSGHEGWVHSVRWWQSIDDELINNNKLLLVSSSADKTIIIWRPGDVSDYDEQKKLEVEEEEEEEDILIPRLSSVNKSKDSSIVWEIIDKLGEVGGHTLGFYQGLINPITGLELYAIGHNGSLQFWKRDVEESRWVPQPGVSGHFRGIEDITWDPKENFLMTCSLDQTTRIVAPWVSRQKVNESDKYITWHEIARPQIHGYDIHCITFCEDLTMVSGADEKVIRIFTAPETFVDQLVSISNVSVDEYRKNKDDSKNNGVVKRPIAASVPALGLSNKAIYNEENSTSNNGSKTFEERMEIQQHGGETAYTIAFEEAILKEKDYNVPPTEQMLLQRTLWVEIDKLYGHGHEIMTVEGNIKNHIIASVSKATNKEQAKIRLWQMMFNKNGDNDISKTSNKAIGEIEVHDLTVTVLKYNKKGDLLLSLGRDRSISITKISKTETEEFSGELIIHKLKAHKRIIWDGTFIENCWLQYENKCDNNLILTGSRDKLIHLWAFNINEDDNSNIELKQSFEFSSPVTALSFLPYTKINDNKLGLIAIGHENGEIDLLELIIESNKDYKFIFFKNQINPKSTHISTVKALKFTQNGLLASGGEDHSIRIFKILMNNH